jgi:hypothetical protein
MKHSKIAANHINFYLLSHFQIMYIFIIKFSNLLQNKSKRLFFHKIMKEKTKYLFIRTIIKHVINPSKNIVIIIFKTIVNLLITLFV